MAGRERWWVRRPVVVANGPKGEPASRKDAFLLTKLPHLVLDGASLAAATSMRTASWSTCRNGCSHPSSRPSTSADVSAWTRLPLKPSSHRMRISPGRSPPSCGLSTMVRRSPLLSVCSPSVIGAYGGGPTLVQNVELLAHVAMISRFGGQWFRSVGTAESPGTMLVTVTGRWPEPLILEAPLGTSFKDLLGLTTQAAEEYWGRSWAATAAASSPWPTSSMPL